MAQVVDDLGARATLVPIEHADHGFEVLVRSGRTSAEVMVEVLDGLAKCFLIRLRGACHRPRSNDAPLADAADRVDADEAISRFPCAACANSRPSGAISTAASHRRATALEGIVSQQTIAARRGADYETEIPCKGRSGG